MITILAITWFLGISLVWRLGIREGRAQREDEIKHSWSQSQLSTHDWLNGELDELPVDDD
jgi:hypothetical protein